MREPRPPSSDGGGAALAAERAWREESGRLLATLIRVLGDWDAAEEALQDALATALDRWPKEGLPRNPAAWLTVAARRKARDRLRRNRARELRESRLAAEATEAQEAREEAMRELQVGLDCEPVDDRLRLVFTCCHPALAPEARVALTLRTLCGLQADEIARAFLLPVPTMQQRLVRAKKKIREARIPYRVPTAEELPERLPSVLAVVYLVFNEGHVATTGESLVRSLPCEEAIRLARLLVELLPDEPEARGLLALLLLQDSRRRARQGPGGELILLPDQDRTLWDAAQATEGRALVEEALRGGRPGPYQLQAAIAAVHSEAPTAAATDWPQVVALYDLLLDHLPTPVVALNRAVAVAEAQGPAAGLVLADSLGEALENYPYLHSTRASFLQRLGRRSEARRAYERALGLTGNEPERRFLRSRLEAL